MRQLPDWPQSASSLFDRLRKRITREHLLNIASIDPFGAHLHFPILVKFWASGRVPATLGFEPGEALRLRRWGGPDVDQISLAFCCTLLCISADDTGGNVDPASFIAPLVDSCLTLGDDMPVLAEQLLAWRAVTEPADVAAYGSSDGCLDPVALFALLLLRAAADPHDVRLPGLVDTLAGAFGQSDTSPWHEYDAVRAAVSTGGHARTWRRLVTTVLTPLRPTWPSVDRLVTALAR